jgi:hypothetical protein
MNAAPAPTATPAATPLAWTYIPSDVKLYAASASRVEDAGMTRLPDVSAGDPKLAVHFAASGVVPVLKLSTSVEIAAAGAVSVCSMKTVSP